MSTLSKRLEIRLDPSTLCVLQAQAHKEHASIGELIRRAVEKTYLHSQKGSPKTAAQHLCSLGAPVADWPQMEKEIEGGYE